MKPATPNQGTPQALAVGGCQSSKKNKKPDRNEKAKKMARLCQANRLLESNIQDFQRVK